MIRRVFHQYVRGINDNYKRAIIKGLLRNGEIEFICLLETKLKVLSDSIVNNLRSTRNSRWFDLLTMKVVGEFFFTMLL